MQSQAWRALYRYCTSPGPVHSCSLLRCSGLHRVRSGAGPHCAWTACPPPLPASPVRGEWSHVPISASTCKGIYIAFTLLCHIWHSDYRTKSSLWACLSFPLGYSCWGNRFCTLSAHWTYWSRQTYWKLNSFLTLGTENTQEKQLTTAAGSHNLLLQSQLRCAIAYSSLNNTRNTAISLTAECKRAKAGESERASDFQMGKESNG